MAKWFTMPEGVDSISAGGMEFHPRVMQGALRYFAVPDHLELELSGLNIRTGADAAGRPTFARFLCVERPEGAEDEPELPAADSSVAEAARGQILSLQVRLEGLRAQIAELTVERDDLRLRVMELEAEVAELRGEEIGSEQPKPSLRLTNSGSPTDSLLDQLSGMTFGKD